MTVNCQEVLTLNLAQYQCEWIPTCGCPPVVANPDAAGRGVIVALLATTIIATVVVTAHFILSWIHAVRCRIYESRGALLPTSRHTDTGSTIQSKSLTTSQDEDGWTRWLEGLKSTAISLSDQQLVTGLSLLIATWMSYRAGSLDSYHFSLVIQLVIFSTSTHTASLLLRYGSYWTSTPGSTTKVGRVPWMGSVFVTTLRVGCIYATVAGLIFGASQSSALAVNIEWSGCPAKCMTGLSGAELVASDVGGILPLVAIYVIYIPCYCIPALHNSSAQLMSKGTEVLATLLGLHRPTQDTSYGVNEDTGHKSRRSLYAGLFLKMCCAQLLVVYIGTIIGAAGLSNVLKWGRQVLDATQLQAEEQWGFGQIVPVALLLIPLISVMETLIDYSPDRVISSGENDQAVDQQPSPTSLHMQHFIASKGTANE